MAIATRIVSLILNWFIILILFLIIGFYSNLNDTATFSLSNQFTVRVSACDVELLHCEADSRRDCVTSNGVVEINWSIYSTLFSIRYTVDQDVALGITANNNDECTKYPGHTCSAFCLIKLYLPPGDARVLVVQEPDDKQRIRVSAHLVEMDSLIIQGGNVFTQLEASIFRTGVNVNSGEGQIEMTKSTATVATLTAADNNIIVQDDSSALEVVYRSTSGRSCFAQPPNNVFSLDPNGVWSECDIGWPNGESAVEISKRYDGDRNGFVSVSEFGEGLDALPKCCGR